MSFWTNPKWYWLRWILVLPVGLLALVLGEILVNLLLLINSWFFGFSDHSPYSYVVNLMAAGLGGFYFVFFGSLTAPLYKKVCALILLILLVFSAGVVLTITFKKGVYFPILLQISSVVGAAICYFKLQEEGFV